MIKVSIHFEDGRNPLRKGFKALGKDIGRVSILS